MSELTFEQMLEESLKTIHAGEVFLPRTNIPTTLAWILPQLPRLVTPWKSRF